MKIGRKEVESQIVCGKSEESRGERGFRLRDVNGGRVNGEVETRNEKGSKGSGDFRQSCVVLLVMRRAA